MARTKLQKVLSVDAVRGDRVYNPEGEDLGRIEDLMLDLETGSIAYAVLSFGGFLGLGDKHFAIPWQALRLDQERSTVVLDIPRERLKDAQGFDRNDPPNFADRSWGAEVHSHYGYDPYWQYDRSTPQG
jgi:sporulation protein YlmC with PRC-barrel domain